jgi:hypothetical protein
MRFPSAHRIQQVAGPEFLIGNSHLAQHAARNALLLAPAINGEILRVAQLPNVPSEDLQAMGVKGCDLRPLVGLCRQQLADSLLHLVGRLVRECDGQNATGLNP